MSASEVLNVLLGLTTTGAAMACLVVWIAIDEKLGEVRKKLDAAEKTNAELRAQPTARVTAPPAVAVVPPKEEPAVPPPAPPPAAPTRRRPAK